MRDAKILITAGSCKLTLNLPAFLEGSTLTKTRKALSLLAVDPWDNSESMAALGRFLDEYRSELQKGVTNAKAIEQAHQKSICELKSQIACFGSMATAEMKKRLLEAQRQQKNAAKRLALSLTASAKADKINAHYQELKRRLHT